MLKRSLADGTDPFDVALLEAPAPRRIVLFSVGAGGNPERHLPLLERLAEHGCTVIAPYFDRLLSPTTSEDDLLLRARRLRASLDHAAKGGVPVAGVGHSIGAAMLLALAGARVWMRNGNRLTIEPDPRIDRLALLAPATEFFSAPGALDAVTTPILAWAGGADVVTPPAQAQRLERELGSRIAVDVRVTPGADHFSFMNALPPTVLALPNRDALLAEVAREVCRFVAS